MEVVLTSEQRSELERLLAQATAPAQEVRRAQVVPWSADAIAGTEIARRLHLSAEAVSRIRHRFLDTGVAELATRRKAGERTTPSPRRPSSASSSSPCRSRRLGTAPGPRASSRRKCVPGSVSDVLRRHALKLPRVRTYMRTYKR